MPLAFYVGWAGAVLSTLTAVVQAIRVRRCGVDGVNATTWALFLLMSAFWLAYGVATGSAQVAVSAVAGVPPLVALLWMLERRARLVGLGRATLAVGVAATVPALCFGWNAGLLGLGVLIVATRLPQIVQLVVARHAVGVSTGSWLVGAAGVALWLVYYLATGRTAAAVTMALAMLANVAIVVLSLRRHRVARATALASAPALALAGP